MTRVVSPILMVNAFFLPEYQQLERSPDWSLGLQLESDDLVRFKETGLRFYQTHLLDSHGAYSGFQLCKFDDKLLILVRNACETRTGSAIPCKSGSLGQDETSEKNRPSSLINQDADAFPRPTDFSLKINTIPSSGSQDLEKKEIRSPLQSGE